MYQYETFPDRPKVDMRYFWEYDKEATDWQKCYKDVIHRIVHRAPEDQWSEMVAFYGEEKVKNALLN